MLSTFRKCVDLMDRKARRSVVLLSFLVLGASCLEALGVGVIFPFIKLLQDPSSAGTLPYLGPVLMSMDVMGQGNFLVLSSVLIFLLFLFKNVFLMVTFYASKKFVQDSRVRLTSVLLDGYVRGPYALHLDKNSAEIIRNLNSSTTVVYSGAVFSFVEIVLESVTAVAILVMLLLVNFNVTVGVFALLVAGFAVFFLILPRWMRRLGVETNRYNKALILNLQQCLGAIKEIKVLGREKFFEDTYMLAARADARIKVAVHTLRVAPRHVIEVALILGMLVVVYALSGPGERSEDMFAVLGVFTLAAYRLLPSANRILGAVNSINMARAALDDVHRDIEEFAAAAFVSGAEESNEFLPFTDSITIENLTYNYPGAADAALTDLNQHIRKGESIGIVGRSGAGKTTLIDIVLGVLTPTSGRLLVDGKDVAAGIRDWQNNIGYIPQSSYMTDDTLRRNVAFGIEDRLIDETRVDDALKAAYLHDFVSSLDQGLDTVVGENGVRLSGGQRQRVSIARALYHDPDVLVMDEATSAVDSETESRINAAINELRGQKTILIIAHRLSTVRNCDRLFYLDGGHLVDAGDFDTLMKRNSGFRTMVRHGDWAEGAAIDDSEATYIVPRASKV